MSTWGRFSLRELRESGLLWEVNRDKFWPNGLALTVEYDEDEDEYNGQLYIQQISPLETIVDGIEDPSLDHPSLRFAKWSRERRAACVIGDARAVLKGVTGEEAPWPVDS